MHNYQDKIKVLRQAIDAYTKGKPIMTDSEYDALMQELISIEEETGIVDKDSPTINIGEVTLTNTRNKHIKRMWSQQNIFTTDEFRAWDDKIRSKGIVPEYLVEYKYDGVSIKLTYDKGELVKASLRGDGLEGDDITDNARAMGNVPKNIIHPKLIEIDGEGMMSRKSLRNINKLRVKANKPELLNTRNGVAGMIRSKDSSIIESSGITFIPWGIDKDFLPEIKKYSDIYKFLTDNGFSIYKEPLITTDIEEVISYYNSVITTERDSLDIGIDGLVVKINDIEDATSLGTTNKYRKSSCAMKFPPDEVVSTLLSIVNQVSRTGVVTPVAKIKPVVIADTTVSSVTLHNYADIAKKGYKMNDKVVVTRSGECIPKIIKVHTDRRTGDEVDITPPTNCPVCNSVLEVGRVYIRCVNPDCNSKLLGRVTHFASRQNMAINGLGISITQRLIDAGLITSILDIYKLTEESLSNNGFKPKTIKNILTAINNSKGKFYGKLLGSLGIPGLSRELAVAIVRKYGNTVGELTKEDLMSIPNLGEVTATNIVNYFKDNHEFVAELYSLAESTTDVANPTGKLSGKVVVLTGTMPGGKSVVAKLVTDAGGTVSNNVTSKTDMLVYGLNPGSKKAKAIKLKIPVYTLEEFKNSL